MNPAAYHTFDFHVWELQVFWVRIDWGTHCCTSLFLRTFTKYTLQFITVTDFNSDQFSLNLFLIFHILLILLNELNTAFWRFEIKPQTNSLKYLTLFIKQKDKQMVQYTIFFKICTTIFQFMKWLKMWLEDKQVKAVGSQQAFFFYFS